MQLVAHDVTLTADLYVPKRRILQSRFPMQFGYLGEGGQSCVFSTLFSHFTRHSFIEFGNILFSKNLGRLTVVSENV